VEIFPREAETRNVNAAVSGEPRIEARPSKFRKKRAAIVESGTGSGANVSFSWDKSVYGEVLSEPEMPFAARRPSSAMDWESINH
jgi:hypothetical protein